MQDLPLSHSITAVTAVPPWDHQRIAEIRRAEARDPWACEAALLANEMALSNNLGDTFVKALKADLDGGPVVVFVVHCFPASFLIKLSVPPPTLLSSSAARNRALPRLGAQELSCFHLVALWINRTRFLVSCIYEAILLGDSKPIPSRLVEVLRCAVLVLLRNMAELGRASIRYGNFHSALDTGHFVPCQATMVFIMAEFFVDRVRYDGDGDTLRRSFLFRELSTLFDIMVTHPKYGELGYDFPGFPAPRGDLRKIGFSPDIKMLQQRGLFVWRGELHRGFGQKLARYNPTLLDFDIHRIALPELVATRPNTPEIEEGEISGPSLVNQVDDLSGDVVMVVNEKDVENVDEDDFLDGFLDDPDVPS
ncbi:hypothetical protein C8J57DRAFT_1492334 [Mycena rebaudengoi]|nr:hypothetical protein C8J57DRAFT_1492334 [Mycena rebaudengoi]